jgi:hypothetical protein
VTDAEFAVLIEKVQKDAEAHLERLQLELWEVDYGEDEEDISESDDWPLQPAGPFCGCTTCVVREVLHAAFDGMKALLEDEVGTQSSPQR